MLCVYVENIVVANWMKIELFARVCVCVCLHVNKVRTCVFLWSWQQRVSLVKEGRMPFPFESYGAVLCCPFITSRSGKEWMTLID